MSHRKRHQWSRRLALGLALAAAIFAGRVSAAAAAEIDGSTDASVYVSGWASLEGESGLGAGIPYGDDQVLPEEDLPVIPYLSHGILTPEAAQAASVRPLVSRSRSRRRPDGDEIAIKNVLQSRGKLTSAELAFVKRIVGTAAAPAQAEPERSRSEIEPALDDTQRRVEHALEAQGQGGLSGHMLEVADAVLTAAEPGPERLTGPAHGVLGETGVEEQGAVQRLTPQHLGTDFPD
jgi:hypothetical protein